ncbi:hypothetical protein H1Q59_04335 [Holosporaceae bacterium 'Namur']|nr:hypothetical protein [Holosporaceae bacterium 'Namur']
MQPISDIYLSRALGHRRRRRSMQYAALLATAYILPRLKTPFFFSLPYESPSFDQRELNFLPLELRTYTGKINKNVISEPHYFEADLGEIDQKIFVFHYNKLNFGINNYSVAPIQEVYPKSFLNKLSPLFEFNRFSFSMPKHNAAYGNSNNSSGTSKDFKGHKEFFSDDKIKEAFEEAENYRRSATKEEEGAVNIINLSSKQIKYPGSGENKGDIKPTDLSLIFTTDNNFSIADAYDLPLISDDNNNHCRISLFNVNLPPLSYIDNNIPISQTASISQEPPTFTLTFVENEKAAIDNTIKFLTSNNFPFLANLNNYPLAIYHGSTFITFKNNSITEQAVNIEESKLDLTLDAAKPAVEKDVPHFPRNQKENQNNTYHNHPPTITPFSNDSICLKPFIKETAGKNSPNDLLNTISNQFNWSDFISNNFLYSALYIFGVAALYKLSLKSFYIEPSFVEDKSLKHKDTDYSNTGSQDKEEDYKTKDPPKDDTHNNEGDDKDEGDDQSDEDEGDDPKDGDSGKIKIIPTKEITIKLAEEEVPPTISLLGDLEDDEPGEVDIEFVTNEVKRDHFNEENRKRAKEEAIEAEKKAEEEARKLEEEATKAEIEATIKKQKEARKTAKKAEQDKESQRKLDEELKQKELERKREEERKEKAEKEKRRIEDKINKIKNKITAEEDELNSLYKNKNKIKKSLKEAKQITTKKESLLEDIKSSIEAKESLRNKSLEEIKQKQKILEKLNILKEDLLAHLATYNELNNEIDSQLQLIQSSEKPDVGTFNLFKETKEAKKAKILEDIINIINRNLDQLDEVVDTYDLRRALEEDSDINSVIPIVNAIIENETRAERILNSEIARYNEEIYELVVNAQKVEEESNQENEKVKKLRDELKEINKNMKLLREELTEASRTLDEEISSLEAQLKLLREEFPEVSRTLDEEISSIEDQLKLLREEFTEVSRTLDEEIEETEEQESTSSTTPLPIPSPTPLPSPTPTPLPIPSPTPLPIPSPTPLPIPSPTPLPIPSPTPLPIPSPTHSITDSFAYSITDSFAYSITDSFAYSITDSFAYSITDSFAYSVTEPSAYSGRKYFYTLHE